MAITSISISQDNIVSGSNLVPIHSPVVFIADATYTGLTPDELYVDIIDDSVTVATYRCIPYADLLTTLRQFAFVANDAVKALMDSFDDEFQLIDTLIPVAAITKTLTLKFYNPEDDLINDTVEITFIHGAAQFGSDPNLTDIFNNVGDVYYAAKGSFLYVYFYNDDATNIVDVDGAVVTYDFAQDYDDTIFQDYDDENFEIQILV